MAAGGFTFDQPSMDWNATDTYQEFKRFKEHVSFVFAGPLSKASPAERAGWLGMWVGQQGRELHKTLTWADGEREDPDKVLEKYEAYVSPRKNKRIARFRFHQRVQKEGETFDTFLKDLRLIAMDCQFDNTDDILVDAIISGARHKKVQERLLNEGQELGLPKSIQIARQFELSQQHMREMRGEDSGIASIKPRKTTHNTKTASPYPATKHSNKKQQSPPSNSRSSQTCDRCGNDTTHRKTNGKCPAMGAVCTYCKKKNHWQTVCRTKLSHSVCRVEPRSPEDTSETSDSEDSDPAQDRFYISAVSTHRKLRNQGTLRRSRKSLYSYSNHKISSHGVAKIPVKCKGIQLEADFEVVDLEQENIISGELAEQLGPIQRVNKVADRTGTETRPPPELDAFSDLANVTGTLPGTYTIKIDPSAQGVVHPTRRQPVMLREKIIEKLKEMESDEHIVRVEDPTEWVSSMVVSVRKDKVRICIDPPRDLNKAIKREHHPMKTIEEVVSSMPDAKVFSVLDAKSGFLQIKLDHESSMLTTFNTPIGRFRWLRLPFGIKCAPEIYQRIMDQMLENIQGATAIMDDILIAGRDTEHHDQILRQVIEKATSYNLRLNYEKCHIRQQSVKYVGHLITADGLKPDPEKTKAVAEMPEPKNQADVKRFLGFVTYLSKFIPNLSEADRPLRSLLKSDVEFEWRSEHKASFQKLKELCTHAPVLAYYDPHKSAEIQCDASSSGIGAVLLQDGKPVAYTSRSMTTTESRYAQIEKEMLSIVHAATKFHHYIFGKHVQVYNDHKPLETIFLKPLLSAPMRLQRMLLKLQWYDLTVSYRKGKDMQLADTLSRAYLHTDSPEDSDPEYINTLSFVPITSAKHAEMQRATANELSSLYQVILAGWPELRKDVDVLARPYWDSRDQLSVLDGIIFKGMRIVIPPSLRSQMLKLIHESHLGIVKCKQRAREVMYWPAMNADVEDTVRKCDRCAQYQSKLPREPLQPTPVPDLPFSEIGIDLFDFESKHYLILVDYYSKFIEVDELHDQTTYSIVRALKNQYSRHGIPEKCRSDNGPQFSSSDFRQFCEEYGVKHITSSPHFQRSNGEAERGIQTVKRIWKKSKDKHKALLNYRTTPLEGINLSPAQLLMGRRPRNTLPSCRKLLAHTPYNKDDVRRHFELEKAQQKYYHDYNPGVKPLPSINPNDTVRMAPLPGSDSWLPATVIKHHESPRSFVVECQGSGRKYRRNRRHLRPCPPTGNSRAASFPGNDVPTCTPDFLVEHDNSVSPSFEDPSSSPPTTSDAPKTLASDASTSANCNLPPGTTSPSQTTRSGRLIKKPKRLDL